MWIRSVSAAALAVGAACLLLGAGPARAGKHSRSPRVCSAVATEQAQACQAEIKADLFEAQALCSNGPESERRDCLRDAQQGFKEGNEECRDQREARKDLCDALGEGRYDPDFDPAAFRDDFTSPNPYFPLSVGDHWEYAGENETGEVTVLGQTKQIEGVTCIVVRDLVKDEDGRDVEDTDDWIAQRVDGTADYCGEISQNFEFFEGDDPELRELVDIEGSWKAGRDGALPGTLFPATPLEGDVYRQEWSPGTAEDAAEVLSTQYRFGSDAALDQHVPAALAQHLCTQTHPCVVTGEFTPIEPDAFERKYYAYGIGLFLVVNPASGEISRLVDCNVDPLCAALPQP
jgi:hypothetical protein